MSQKYHTSALLCNHISRTVTNDLYFAAYLLCQRCILHGLVHNGRRRVSFVFSGENIELFRSEYESGTVRLNVRTFRENLLTVRKKMDEEQRSVYNAPSRTLTTQSQH